MAAQTSSTSYRGTLTEDVLLEILKGGAVPDEFGPHVGHLLDEAPIQIVVMAVTEAAHRSGMPIEEIWRNVAQLARRHSDCRRDLWTRRG